MILRTRKLSFAGALLCVAFLGCGVKPEPQGWQGTFSILSDGSSSFRAFSQKALPAKGDQNVSVQAEGDIWVRRITRSPNVYVLGFSRIKASFNQNGVAQLVPAQTSSEYLLHNRIYFSLGAGFRVDTLYTASAPDLLSLLIVRNILSQWSGGLPLSGKRVESDIGGSFLVQTSNESKNNYLRTFLDSRPDSEVFVSMPGRTVLKPEIVVKGDAKIQFASDGSLSQVDFHRNQKTSFAKEEAGQSDEVVTIRLKTVDENPIATAPDLTNLVRNSLVARNNAESSEEQIQAKELGSLRWKDIRLQIPANFRDGKDRVNLFLKLRALFYLHPEEIEFALKEIAIDKTENQAFQLTVESLAATGTNSSQDALVRLGNSRTKDSSAMQLILRSVTQLPNPSDSLVRFVRRLAESTYADRVTRYAAQLTFGSLARRLRESNDPRMADASAFLVQELKEATDEDSQLNLLYAVGNSAPEEIPPKLMFFLNSSSPRLRAGAIHALRLIPSDQVETIIEEHVRTESDQGVRSEAQQILGARKAVKNQK